MKSYFYPKSLYTSIVAFADQFNDMSTRVYDRNGRIVGVKPVVMTLAPKEKISSILIRTDVNDVDPQVDNYLPRISVNMTGMSLDSARLRGKFDKRVLNIEYFETTENGQTKRREIQRDVQPVPYNLTFEVIIWTKYDCDMKQITENIIPWFAPQDHISIKERSFGIERKCKATLDNVTLNNVFELGESDRRVLQTNMSFTMETVAYKPMEIEPEILCSIISIMEVPCNRRPFEGEKIIIKDVDTDEPFCLEDRSISLAIEHLDDMDGYDNMVQYWQYANNNMNPTTYVSCTKKGCFEPLPNRPTWDIDSDYEKCNPPIKNPIIKDNTETGKIDWYYQDVITGTFDYPDILLDGFIEDELPPLNSDGTRTFGKPDIINVWHFKRIVEQSGETSVDEYGNKLVFLLPKNLYPEVPEDLQHLG